MSLLFAAGGSSFQLLPQVGSHISGQVFGDVVGFLVCPPFHLFLVHHGGDGLFSGCFSLGLPLVGPALGRLGHLPGACKLVFRVLGAGFGLALHLPCFLFPGFGGV